MIPINSMYSSEIERSQAIPPAVEEGVAEEDADTISDGGIVAGHGEPATVFHEEDVELPRDESEKEEAVSAA